MLNNMQAALIKARGFEFQGVERVSDRDSRAVATKGVYRAEALGRGPVDASAKLVMLITRR